MNARERQSLDRHITGNFGEDQFKKDDSIANDMDDVQQQLEDHLNNLDDATVDDGMDTEGVEHGVGVGQMFQRIVRLEIPAAKMWDAPMHKMRVSTLRNVSRIAGRYGLNLLAGIIREHIQLRQLESKRPQKRMDKFIRNATRNTRALHRIVRPTQCQN